MTPGIFQQSKIDELQYHAETGHGEGLYITRSMICCMDTHGPQGFWLRHVEKSQYAQQKENDGMRLGCLVEDMLLGQDLSGYIERPDTCVSAKGEEVPWNRRKGQRVAETGESTLEWEERAALEGKTVLDAGEMARCRFMIDMLARSEWGANVLASLQSPDLERQVVCRWQDEDTGLWLQTRIDCLLRPDLLIDLKSTAKDLRDFGKSAYEYGYDIQSVMYAEGLRLLGAETRRMIFPCICTTFPYNCGVAYISDDDVPSAERRYRAALSAIAREAWTDHPTGLYAAKKPAWAWYREEENNE